MCTYVQNWTLFYTKTLKDSDYSPNSSWNTLLKISVIEYYTRILPSQLDIDYTVKPVLSDHIKQDIFWLLGQVVAYCCMKVVQKAELSALLSFSNKQTPVYSVELILIT